MTPDPPSLTTVPDAAGGRRNFTGVLIAMCLLAVVALGFAMFKSFTRERPMEEIARTHFQWDYRFALTKATETKDRADAWYTSTDPRMKPENAVDLFVKLNPPRGTLTAPHAVRALGGHTLRRVGTDSSGEKFGVEYDTKRRLYHVWWQAAP